MLGFVGTDSFLELLFADVTPRTHRVADYFDVELGHPAQRWPEHAKRDLGYLKARICTRT